jgi:hypothetical protein
MTSHLIKGQSPLFRQPPATVPPAIDGGGSPVVVAAHLIAGRGQIFRQPPGSVPAEIVGGGSPIVIGPHLIRGMGQIYRQPGGCGGDYEWLFGLSAFDSSSQYFGVYWPDPAGPYIEVHAGPFGSFFVRLDLPGLLTFPQTPILTITDTDITMTVGSYTVTALYSDGPVAPPDFAALLYIVTMASEGFMTGPPACSAYYENVIGNGTNFGSGYANVSFPGPWSDPFVGQVTFLAPS